MNLTVRCVEVVGEASKGDGKVAVTTCGRTYVTSRSSFLHRKNKCPACDGKRAQEVR